MPIPYHVPRSLDAQEIRFLTVIPQSSGLSAGKRFRASVTGKIAWSAALITRSAASANKAAVRPLETAPRNLPFIHQAVAREQATGFGTSLPFQSEMSNDRSSRKLPFVAWSVSVSCGPPCF